MIKINRHTLDNGLELVHFEDKSTQMVANYMPAEVTMEPVSVAPIEMTAVTYRSLVER